MKRRPHKYKLVDILPKGDQPDQKNVSPYEEDMYMAQFEDEIDERLEALNEYLGREITRKERRGLLDIVCKYTPRDKDGDIIGEYLPFEYAWDIYQIMNARGLDEFLEKLEVEK